MMRMMSGVVTEKDRRPFTLNIRSKIIVPYLILTLVVAVIGTYVVTTLVASSLDERLNNHLLEAGRVVSDTLVRQELGHLETARLVAFTRGLAEALQAGNRQQATAIAGPAAANSNVEILILTDAAGSEIVHLLRRADGSLERVEGYDLSTLWLTQSLLERGDPDSLPVRAIGRHPADQRLYYFTAIPVPLQGQVVGVAVVGTSLDTLLPYLKATSLADVTIHGEGGQAIASTMLPDEVSGEEIALETLSISPHLYQQLLTSTELTIGENARIHNRWYRLLHGSLRVGDSSLGVFTVALPSQFIIQAGTTSRNTYALLFALAMAAVILVGYVISQRITTPLSRLVQTSRAVAEGDLTQRTNIRSTDEVGILAATFDEMTDRLHARTRELEQLLYTYQEASGRLRAILLSMRDGVLLEDTQGNLVPLNPAAQSFLEECPDPQDVLARLVQTPSPAAQRAGAPQPLESNRFEVGRRVISIHKAAVRTDEGRHLGNVIVLRDVTAEVEAERLKDAFVAHVSHELRTPLTAIKGYNALVLASAGDRLDEQQKSFLHIINRNTDDLVAMIDELLAFSEMEARGGLGLQRQVVSLADIVGNIATVWEPQMQSREINFVLDISPSLPPVEADPRRLRWAIVNLVRNAWQYTPPGGCITLCLSSSGDHVTLDVIDTGRGISAEQQQHLFTRFQRAASDEQSDVRGMGLGLYVTRAIVEAHQGQIAVTSQEGIGSTFSITLPALPTSMSET